MRAPAILASARVLLPAAAARSPAAAAELDARRTWPTPSAVFVKDGQPVTFALLGFIEFKTLEELFAYIDREAGRWSFPSAAARQAYGDGLLRRGVESRLVSMTYEKPLELLLTHTREELDRRGRPAGPPARRRSSPDAAGGWTRASTGRRSWTSSSAGRRP